MITLAAGGGDLIFLIAMLVFGAINWLANKSKEGQQPKKPAAPSRTPRPQPSAEGDAEAERMRRFLEALGVPGDASPPTAPTPAERPATPRRPRAEKRKRNAPPPLPASSLGDEAVPGRETARSMRMPDLAPLEPVFQTVSSRVMADPDGEFATVSSTVAASPIGAARIEQPPAARGVDNAAVRAALRAPESLRTALILREVLGPPVGLRGRGGEA